MAARYNNLGFLIHGFSGRPGVVDFWGLGGPGGPGGPDSCVCVCVTLPASLTCFFGYPSGRLARCTPGLGFARGLIISLLGHAEPAAFTGEVG
jgi:hypothetical protein